MNKLMEKSTRTLGKVGFKLKKHSPEILIIAGVTGLATSFVMACRATLKASKVLGDAKLRIEETVEAVEISEPDEYTEEDKKRDEKIIYVQTGMKLAGLYAPSIFLAMLSVSCMISSNVILKKRNVNLAAAYMLVDRGFKEYRSRVVERFGEDVDKELRFGVKEEEIEEVTVGDGGIEVAEKKVMKRVCLEPDALRRCYDEGCLGWSKDAEVNHMFLVHQQNYANDKLKRQGYLFLNDVYEMLGFQKTKEGQVMGWVYDEENPIGNNYVDFGIYDMSDDRKRAFVNGYERSIWLDFNVDGNILDKI